MSVHESASSAATLLRNDPVQARSTARLGALLDAAAEVVDEIGFERLTTAMVAERAGASIGTVYRYFPDRIVVLQGLSARLLQNLGDHARAAAGEAGNRTWLDAVDAGLAAIVEAYRTVPGFRSLRLGDVIDIARPRGAKTGSSEIAGILAEQIARFGLPAEDLVFHLEVALVLADSLLARAFFADRDGDRRFIEKARAVARNYLTGVYATPST